ncbi:MAG: hypothetical protein OXL34_15770 [Gemmatimonadota bacterium]|nr:hypothetical protein [Gemmatimonadota bacterium]
MTDRLRQRGCNGFAIDVGALMRDLPASPNANLVTRPTGRAVREAIEGELSGAGHLSVSVIDLTGVGVLDFSCADEVVAKLLLRYLPAERPGDIFFLFRAVREVHGHAVDEVLARHGLAAVCDFGEGGCSLLGPATTEERAAWSTLERRERIGASASAPLLGARGEALLLRLSERRLILRDSGGTACSLSALARHLPDETRLKRHGEDDGH